MDEDAGVEGEGTPVAGGDTRSTSGLGIGFVDMVVDAVESLRHGLEPASSSVSEPISVVVIALNVTTSAKTRTRTST
jgi:hypothetical protein